MTAPRNLDFDIRDVLAWARTKPADERYDYCKTGDCAIAQFLKETRRSDDPSVCILGWRVTPSGDRRPYDVRIATAANDEDETFGGFADRLEALCPPSEWVEIAAYLGAPPLADGLSPQAVERVSV